MYNYLFIYNVFTMYYEISFFLSSFRTVLLMISGLVGLVIRLLDVQL